MNDTLTLISPTLHTLLSCSVAIAAAVMATRHRDPSSTWDWRWVGVIGLLLLVGRWPSIWFPFGLNPDESQFIAGAHTLRVDPLFWHSVNGMTSGPLNFYALWPAGFLFGYGSYLGARLTAAALLLCTLGFLHLAFARRFTPRAARLGGLPAVCFLSFTAQPDFIHYSSELFSIALVSLAGALTLESLANKWASVRVRFGIGFLLGLIPFAKLQAAPMGLFLGLVLVTWPWRWPAKSVFFRLAPCLGALVPISVIALVVWAGGVGDYAWHTYLRQNVNYVSMGEANSWHTAFQILARPDPSCPLFFAWMGTGGLGLLLLSSWLQKIERGDLVVMVTCGGLLLVSIFCVLTPGRAFPHYLLLTIVPWTALLMAIVGILTRAMSHLRYLRVAATTVMLGSAGLIILVRATSDYPPRTSLTTFRSDFSYEVSDVIQRYRKAGDRLAVWGWRADYFVLSNLPQATRDSVTESSIIPNPERAFAQRCFLQDLQNSSPAFFVDAVGPGNFQFNNRATQSPSRAFPELARWVSTHYTFLTDRNGSRVYLRNDRLPLPSRPLSQRPLARTSAEEWIK